MLYVTIDALLPPELSWDYFGGRHAVVLSIEKGYRAAGLMTSYKYGKLVKEVCPGKPKGTKPSTYLLALHGYKHCTRCDTTYPLTLFRLNASKSDGRQGYCVNCHQETSTTSQPYRQAKYRAARLYATPKWADLSSIQQFYKNTPSGCSVDHIVPLQGKLVCGLHTLENLQYLTTEENSAKGNTWVVDVNG